LDTLGIVLDPKKNESRGGAILEINKESAPVKILVIRTNEELEIARQCYSLHTTNK
jgi:acetate kinase